MAEHAPHLTDPVNPLSSPHPSPTSSTNADGDVGPLVVGAVLTATAGALGAHRGYAATWAAVWNHARFGAPFHATELLGLARFGLAARLLGGPCSKQRCSTATSRRSPVIIES